VRRTEETMPSNGKAYAIGVDFGTASARTLLLDLQSGEEVACSEHLYEHGVIDDFLPTSGERLPSDWALHHPADYLNALSSGVKAVIEEVPSAAEKVIGIGVDTTSCTVLPVDETGRPLCLDEQWERHPHAWPKLWKHHSAQPIADRLNLVAQERGEAFLARYGGKLSSEWYFPKLIEIWLEDKAVYEACWAFVEVTDWLVWYLSGKLVRSACPASYKACWSPDDGFPSAEYFEAAYPGFREPTEKLGTTFAPLGTSAGTLRPKLATELGLRPDTAIAVGNVDSFVSFPGAGVHGSGAFVTVVGTSTCDLAVHPELIPLQGITGVARDGILPGLFGYEAGQAAVGDMLGWFAELLLSGDSGPSATRSVSSFLHQLESEASQMTWGQSGLVALDWWNGNRSILADASLSGVVAGLGLQTTRAEFYRALLEAIAFGNRVIFDNFKSGGFQFERIVACGGLAERAPLLMQLMADAADCPVEVAGSTQVPARGSALFGAVAAGAARGGFDGIAAASRALDPGTSSRYEPLKSARPILEDLFRIFLAMHNTFGKQVSWLSELKKIKIDADRASQTASEGQ
jgi:L-ribulokinase